MADFPLYKQSGWEPVPGSQLCLQLTIAFTVIVSVFELYLDSRQSSRFANSPKLPAELKEHVKDETFQKSIAYCKDKFSFKFVEAAFSFVVGLAFLVGGYLPFAWDLSMSIILKMGLFKDSYSDVFKEILVTWIFVVIITLVDTLTSLPFSLYSTFVVEQKHGFNKSTLGLFIQDKLMTIGLTFLLGIPILSMIIWIVRWGGDNFVFYVWCFLFVISLLLMTIYPVYIAPLFNKYTKLEDGEVKTAIEELARKVEFPLTNIFSVDGSRRSAHSNAYFYGFFKNKRIVLYDTLLKQVELKELLAILGHEIGHWKLWHTIQGFMVAQLYTFCLFLFFSFAQHTPALFVAFGFVPTAGAPMPVFIGLMLFIQALWNPVDKVLSLLMTLNSRKNEFAADAFAASLGMGRDIASGLIKISIENLDNMVPDRWYSWYHYSHPPLVERLRALTALEKATDKKGK